jgi:hypothetical protein
MRVPVLGWPFPTGRTKQPNRAKPIKFIPSFRNGLQNIKSLGTGAAKGRPSMKNPLKPRTVRALLAAKAAHPLAA